MKTIFAENGGYGNTYGDWGSQSSGVIPGEFDITSTSLTQRGFYFGPRRVSLKRLGRALRSRSKKTSIVPVSRYGKVLYRVFVVPKKTVLYIGCVKFKGTAARELREAALKASR